MIDHQPWFSAAIRLDIDIAGEVKQGVRSVVVFRARDFDEALTRAIEVGSLQESGYVNRYSQEVTWKLVEVETIDMLGDSITDGREVYSEPIEYGAVSEYKRGPATLNTSTPGHSGV